jgi:hypothetical protein
MMIARLTLATALAILIWAAATQAGQAPTPKPLSGVPLATPSGLRLLVAGNPPFFLDVDSGRITRVRRIDVHDKPVLSVLAVGKDAVVWLARGGRGRVPAAELYAVRHGSTAATRIGTGWDVAPAADVGAIWLKRYKDARHCTLAEIGLDGHVRRSARPLACSTRLFAAGAVPLLLQQRSFIDPLSRRTLPVSGAVKAIAADVALTSGGLHGPLGLTDLRTGERWTLPWPSEIGGPTSQGGTDQAGVQPGGGLVALGFADPAYQDGGTQVTDVWLLDLATRAFRQLPDMPAAVSLKATSMSWTSDGRLVMLAETGGHDVVAAWRPGDNRIAVKRVQIPVRNSGSDAFVAW